MAEPSIKDPDQPVLIVTGGPHDGTTLLLENPGFERLMGTGADCHLRLEGRNVDHRHARVVWDERGVILFDEASTAGTYVNGERVTGERVLADGDRICLGPPGSPASVKLLTRVPTLLTLPPLLADAKDLEPFALEGDLPPISLDEGAEDQPILLAPTPEEEEEIFEALPEPEAPAPPAPRPAEPIPAVKADRRRSADYQEVPSIVTERPREPVRLPPQSTRPVKLARPAAPRQKTGARIPRSAWIAGVTVIVGGGVVFALLQTRQPPPMLSSVTPPKVEPGQTMTIIGTGFDSSATGNSVRFGDKPGKIVSASETQLTVEAPDGLVNETVSITVESGGKASNALLAKVGRRPRATGLEPDVALPGQEVLLKGQNLATKGLTITVGGRPVDPRDLTATSLRFRVPELPVVEGRTVPVAIQAGGEAARPLNLTLGRLPLVAELAPDNGPAGARVLVRGRGFDPSPAGNVVHFGSDPALILSASDSELTVVAPSLSASENQLRLPVTVRAKGAASSGSLMFTLVRPSMGMYIPRFHAAMVPGEASLAFVSTELGPALLLGGADDATSVAERAVRVAAALNTVIDGARNQPPVFEVRGGTGVGVAGRSDTLVRALPDDAAGYGRPLDPVMRGQHVTPASLATFWVAILQDYATLFVQHQRPTRVVELSPRGKVLLDLYTEAERRVGSGAGVPATLINPLPYALGRALREMVLEAPTRGQATAGAAVTGKWEGTFEEKGAPERPLKLRLTLEGSKLTGFLSTMSGKVSMEVPVQDAVYERGVLSFTISAGAVPRRFRGTVAGSSVAGTIQTAKDGAEIGKFSLRYAE